MTHSSSVASVWALCSPRRPSARPPKRRVCRGIVLAKALAHLRMSCPLGHHGRLRLQSPRCCIPIGFAFAKVPVRQMPRTYKLSGRLAPRIRSNPMPAGSRQRTRSGVRAALPARFPGRCSAMLARLLQDCVAMLALWDWFLLTYRQSRRTGAARPLARVFLWLSRSAKYGASTWCARVRQSFANSTSAVTQVYRSPSMSWCLTAICALPLMM